MSYKKIVFVIFIVILTSFFAAAEENTFQETDQHNNLRLGNDYVVIVVNQQDNARGRFAIETTGGAPARDSDEDKPLVYGRPRPWSSYTTLRIDDENYIFGGETENRAGRGENYGEHISGPEVRDNSIYTAYKINGLIVEQNLSIDKSTTTGLNDSVLIEYTIENDSDSDRELGLRMMLDTMLGQNDGAPFRVGEEEITTDTMFPEEDLPDFWQAFDSVSSPQVTSQGTLRGPGVTPPDKVYFADWGSLAETAWDGDSFAFNPGEEFMRKGEYETDSAIAMHWSPRDLAPGEKVSFSTRYGLGGIEIVPGLLSLGVSSPAEVNLDTYNKSFPVVAYVENTSEIEAEDVKLNIDLPDGFSADQPERNQGNLPSQEITQVEWTVRPTGEEIPDNIDYRVKVEAENTDSNEVERNIKFVAPPSIEADLSLDDNLNVKREEIIPNPFTLRANVTNTGGSTLYFARTELVLPPGLTPGNREKTVKPLGYIRPGETVNINWNVKSLPEVSGEIPVVLNTRGTDDFSHEIRETFNLPEVKPLIYMEPARKNPPEKEEILLIDIKGENLSNIENLNLIIDYDEEFLRPLHISPGTIFIQNDRLVLWDYPQTSDTGTINLNQKLPEDITSGSIARLQFRVKKTLETLPLEWYKLRGFDQDNNDIEIMKEVLNFNEK
ncbi:MAG: hypothetical protein ACOC5A_04120 [Halanaerobiales bacterium]